ncbi:MAG: hypothetical protein KF777_13545 [Planctomycetaceae bacterium]|nr:hypothetical protein [Planctomycetaceae bacterium]
MKDSGQLSLAGLCAGGGALSLTALVAAWVFSPAKASPTVDPQPLVSATVEVPADWSGAVDAAWQPLHAVNETRVAPQVSVPVPVDWVATSFGPRQPAGVDRVGDSSDVEPGLPIEALPLEASAEPLFDDVPAKPQPAFVDDSETVATPVDDPLVPSAESESVSLPEPAGADGQVLSNGGLEDEPLEFPAAEPVTVLRDEERWTRLEAELAALRQSVDELASRPTPESAPRWVAAMGVARESEIPIEPPTPVAEPRPVVIQLDRSRDLSAPLWRPAGDSRELLREVGRPRVIEVARLDARRDRYRAVVRWARLHDVLERLADLSGRRLETTLELAEVVSLDRTDATLDELLTELAGVAGYAVEVTPGTIVVRVHAVASQAGRE